jgi:RNA polymerase sigma-70 factor (ECF subfamily)
VSAAENFSDHPVKSEYSLLMSMHRTDEEIMVAVGGGDLDQLEILFRRYREPLYEFFNRLTGSRMVSEDLVQDVFVRILKYRRTYRETHRFITWMYRIARNARADYLRKHKPTSPESGPFANSLHDITIPSRQFEENEEKTLLQCALRQLSEPNRELLILARFQEMKYEDIAELYGIPLGAVKTRVYRATNELREVFLKLRSDQSSCSATKSATTLPTT